MNKDEYLRRLKNRLNDLNIDGKDEIYNDFTNHFEIGHQNGLSDEELIENLGSIDEVLESYESLSRQEKITVDHHNQPKEFTNKITHVNVQARHANTTLKHSNDNGFHVDLYKDGKLPERLNHTLTAYQEEETFFVNVLPLFPYKSHGDYELTIQVPKNLDSIHLNSSSGDLHGSDLIIHQIEIHSASGDINLDEIHTEQLSMEVASSDVHINKLSGNCEIKSASGDVRISKSYGKKLIYNNASGDLDIDGDYLYIKLNNVSGDVNAEFKTVEQMNVSTTSGDINIRIDNSDNLSIDTHSLSGDCDVYLKGKDVITNRNQSVTIGEPNIPIKLNTVSGDIHLDMA